jgi:hypothetical protein
MSKILPFTEVLEKMGRKMVYHPRVALLIGLKESIILEQMMYWGPKTKPDAGGWVFKSVEDITEETGLTYEEQRRARAELVRRGLIREKYARTEHILYFRAVGETLDALLSEQLGNDQMPDGENPPGTSGNPTSYNEPILTPTPTATPTDLPQQTALDPVVQNQTAVRTRNCGKCGTHFPEDDLREHERGCEGKKKRGRGHHTKPPITINRGMLTKTLREEDVDEAIFKVAPHLRLGSPENKEFRERIGMEAAQQDYSGCYGLMRRAYKTSFGKSLKSFPGGDYGDKLRALIDKNGSEKVIAGFDQWIENTDRDWIRKSTFPMAAFLKDAQGCIDDADIKENSDILGSPISMGTQKPKVQF